MKTKLRVWRSIFLAKTSGRKLIQIFISVGYFKDSKDTIPYVFYNYFFFDILFDFDCLNPLAFILTMIFLFKSFRYLFCIFRPRRKSLLESFSDLTSRMFRKPSLDEPDFLKPSLVEPNCNEHEPGKDRQPFMQFVTRSRVSRTAIWNCTYWLTLFITYFQWFLQKFLLCLLHVLLVMQDINSYLVICLLFQFILETFAPTNTPKIVEEFTYWIIFLVYNRPVGIFLYQVGISLSCGWNLQPPVWNRINAYNYQTYFGFRKGPNCRNWCGMIAFSKQFFMRSQFWGC